MQIYNQIRVVGQSLSRLRRDDQQQLKSRLFASAKETEVTNNNVGWFSTRSYMRCW